ncbi:putative methyltransferase-domain-containing protein, partial [Mycena epipterygia]
PSLRLPPLRGLATLMPAVLLDCIEYLRVLYTPAVRGSRIRRRIPSTTSQLKSPPPQIVTPSLPDLDVITALRADDFERAYTIRWLAYLINNAELLQGQSADVETVVERASALLANCGGTSGAGVIDRVLDFPSSPNNISITLRDIPLENGDFSSVGAQTWGGACVLAEILVAQPADFQLVKRPTPLRVLELGAGTGLVGLALAKKAEDLGVNATVVCTDFYPSVLQNLAANIGANFPPQRRSISSHFLDWSVFSREDPPSLFPPFDQPFDLILGADIVYEPEHAAWIHACVSRFLHCTKSSQFHLVIPLRPTHALESSSVEVVFQRHSQDPTAQALTIISKETIVCDVEGSATEEVEYSYYRIGWDS